MATNYLMHNNYHANDKQRSNLNDPYLSHQTPSSVESTHISDSDVNDFQSSAVQNTKLNDPSSIIFNEIITDATINWQVHNCKILEQTLSEEEPLPFLYHYDALDDEIKKQNPLTADLLHQFNTPMLASEAAHLLGLSDKLIETPWQVKVLGTLVMYSEALQVAIRLKFTNTAKQREPIYTQDQRNALLIAMQNWHFYGDVFVLNKNTHPMVFILDDHILPIERSTEYHALPSEYSIATLALLDTQKAALPQLNDAIQRRLA